MPAILVPSPKHSGNRPVASGSSAPVWPPLVARSSRRVACRAWLELSPNGLSSSRMPCRSRDGAAEPRRPLRELRFAFAIALRLDVARVAQQAFDALALVDRIVVLEAQLGNAAQAHAARERAAEFHRQLVERLDRLAGALRLQGGHPDGGPVEVAGDFHVGHAHRWQRVVAHGSVHQQTQLTAELGAYAVGAFEVA